jgi:hypothetical protein
MNELLFGYSTTRLVWTAGLVALGHQARGLTSIAWRLLRPALRRKRAK